MIEWGTRSSSLNTVNNDYYWQWNENNNTFILNDAGTPIIQLLPAVNFPRMVSLNIHKSSLTGPNKVDVFFYMNQSNLNLTSDLVGNLSIAYPDFQGKTGINILNWEYSGSLYATLDPAEAITGAGITVRTATKVYL